MKKIKVAVGLLTYNHTHFIIDCLKSIHAQNFKKFDLFISDDKSTDDTFDKTKFFLKNNFSRFKLYKQKKNVGVTLNCNFLLKKIRSKYDFLVLISGDDLMVPDRLKLQINLLKRNPRASFCYSNCYWFINSKKYKFQHFPIFQKPPKNFKDLIEEFSIPIPTITYNLKFMRNMLFDEKFKYLSDIIMVLNLWEKSKPVFLNKPLLFYRRHQKSIMMSRNIINERKKVNKFLLTKYKSKYPSSVKNFNALIQYTECINKLKKNKKINFKQYMQSIKMISKSIKWMLRCCVLTFYYLRYQFSYEK